MDGNEKLYDLKGRSDAAGLVCEDPSRTVQADAVDADINVIVRRFNLTGRMPEGLHVPSYQDFEDVFDFQSALAAVELARNEFMLVPAETRARFENSPQRFMEFCMDPANVDEMVALKLVDVYEK